MRPPQPFAAKSWGLPDDHDRQQHSSGPDPRYRIQPRRGAAALPAHLDCRREPAQIAEKSRRTGITWAEAADAALTASKTKTAGGCHHFYVGSNKEMAREFIDAVAMWAKAYNKAAGEIQEEVFTDDEDKAILTFVVYFASGFKVQALSSNPSNLRGMQGNVTIDEAAFHDRLAEVLKAAMALTMWGPRCGLSAPTTAWTTCLTSSSTTAVRAVKYSIHTISLDDACRQGSIAASARSGHALDAGGRGELEGRAAQGHRHRRGCPLRSISAYPSRAAASISSAP